MRDQPKIRTEEIVQFLERVIFEGIPATTSQIRSANILLSKTLPSLQSTKLSGNEDDGSFVIKVIKEFEN
jgi:hypothetical protein